MSTPSLSFRRGSAAVEAASSSSGGSHFQRTEFLTVKNGEKALVRFLTDFDSTTDPRTGELVGGWLGIKQHQSIRTKPEPSDFKGERWPQFMAAPCRRDTIFATTYSDCYICDVIIPSDSKLKPPSHRLWALAVLREEIYEGGKRIGVRDQMRTVTRKSQDGTETTTEEPRLVVVNMGRKNFFDPLSAWANRFGTVLDRDYEIARQGEALDTTYLIIPDIEPVKAQKSDGSYENFDLREDEFMAHYLPSAREVGYGKASDLMLEPIIIDRTTDEFYGRFFDPTWSPTVGASNVFPAAEAPVTAPTPAAAVPAPQSDEDLQLMIQRLQGYEAK